MFGSLFNSRSFKMMAEHLVRKYWIYSFSGMHSNVYFCMQNYTHSSFAQTKHSCKTLITNFVVGGETVDSESQHSFRRVDNAFVYNIDLTVRGQPIQCGQTPLRSGVNKV